MGRGVKCKDDWESGASKDGWGESDGTEQAVWDERITARDT